MKWTRVKLVHFLTETQLPTLNLACCPKARKETNTNCWPRTRTPMFLLSDMKIGLRTVGVWPWSVQLHVRILLPLSSSICPPQTSILNLNHKSQVELSMMSCLFLPLNSYNKDTNWSAKMLQPLTGETAVNFGDPTSQLQDNLGGRRFNIVADQ